MSTHKNAPDLERRFLMPEGWRWHHLSRQDAKGRTRRIRFGAVFPKDTPPDGIVVCLPGLGDFCEKYFEVAHDMLNRNLAFWVIDWVGQGHSTRYLNNPHKRHTAGFKEDVNDVHEWMTGYVLPSAVHTNVGRIPMAMLAHSMGGHIGLHYLHKYPDIFSCAAFSAPMWGIKAVDFMPAPVTLALTGKLNALLGKHYVPGGIDWKEMIRAFPGKDIFSSDPVRGAVHNKWCLFDPVLQVGSVTNKWLYEAVKSCAKFDPRFAQSIKVPCMVGIAGKEMLVSNKAIRRVAQNIPDIDILELPDSQHEILMERDDIRNEFLSAFFELIEKCMANNPEALKPF